MTKNGDRRGPITAPSDGFVQQIIGLLIDPDETGLRRLVTDSTPPHLFTITDTTALNESLMRCIANGSLTPAQAAVFMDTTLPDMTAKGTLFQAVMDLLDPSVRSAILLDLSPAQYAVAQGKKYASHTPAETQALALKDFRDPNAKLDTPSLEEGTLGDTAPPENGKAGHSRFRLPFGRGHGKG